MPGGGASSKASHATSHSKATTHVTVTATDSKFTLSKRSAPTGTVIFTVTNKGKISHDFKIAGKKTPLLAPGHSATLRVTFSKKGRYPYLSTVSGQAAARHEGRLLGRGRGRAHAHPHARAHPTTAPYAPPTGTVGTANTTVTVELIDSGHTRLHRSLSDDDPVGHGHIRDHEQVLTGRCSFDLEGVKAGAILNHGPVGNVDGRAGPGHLPLPLRHRSERHEGIVHRHALSGAT